MIAESHRTEALAHAPAARAVGLGLSAVTVAAFALMVLGSAVRANRAGLACPDWPLCFGQVVPAFDLRVAFEWGHRVLAGSVSLALACMTLWLFRIPPLWRATWRKLALVWGILAAQVVLGGLTVLLQLSPVTVVAHLLTGVSFGLTLLWIARDLLEIPRPMVSGPISATARALGVAAAVCLGLQFLLGGLVSSHAAGLACDQFPTCDGTAFVPTLQGQVGVHVMHRLNGYLLLLCFAGLSFASRRSERLAWLAWTGLRLVLFQIGLGVANVLLLLPVEVTVLHSATAVALAAVAALGIREILRSRAVAQGVPEEVPAPLPGAQPT